MIFSWLDIETPFVHTYDDGRSISFKMHSLGKEGIKISPLVSMISPLVSSFVFKFEGGGLGTAATNRVKGQHFAFFKHFLPKIDVLEQP